MQPTPEMTMTSFLITFIVITITVYDLCIVMFKKNGIQYSVSRFVSVAWLRLPSVCFGCGFLCGHFCGSMSPPTQQELNIIPDHAVVQPIEGVK